MSKVIKEFSRFAHQYDQYNEIQSQVAKTLVSMIPDNLRTACSTIIDLGCGSGAVAKNLQESNIAYASLTAFDSSEAMLDIHPGADNIIKVCGDFNEKHFLERLPQREYDLLLSSSALQWSTDLDRTFEVLPSLAPHAYLAIFTSGTFKTLHTLGNISSPIYSSTEISQSIEKYYDDVHLSVHSYRLAFDSVREMFRYIKKSGVSAGEKKLGFKETKGLMGSYPLDYLEFEVLFAKAKRM